VGRDHLGAWRWRDKLRDEVTTKEGFLLKRLGRTKKLFAFLREVRHELFDEAFEAELETMYRETGAGNHRCDRR